MIIIKIILIIVSVLGIIVSFYETIKSVKKEDKYAEDSYGKQTAFYILMLILLIIFL